ncbi:MAG: Acyl-[acyl-carrier-protein]--UDP-N-acetylglucosamine O-acyltransferase (EC [uncultured Campylobacterales bacterium]|uniref:Acyl-[acyl-carrier-protein]--UDP-N-acetylglucosam ine O-acyltransferase (EC) n=1 Tax=uncultured Campylobacterales bacterium TaxID=352960 RepID=A0A6S6T3S5_9BACT|nr:MAG: Acyl-[acyl-carrier-protein]--UDP-N-acetylglucosamine O-acyltransferase (EC [uncultured Campylobacterales bacterium]
MAIDKRAVIEDGAVLGENVEVGPFSYIGKNVKIANNVKIHSNAVITGNTEMDEGCEVFPFAVLGTDPQDFSYKKSDFTKLLIGKNNTFREHILINTGTLKDKGQTVIGNNNLIMGQVHVAHDVVIADNVILVNAAILAGHVQVKNNSIIGGGSAVHQFVTLGEFSMIAGAAAVSQDIPPYCVAEGNRAELKGLNLVGLRRSNIDKTEIDELRQVYRKLFRTNDPIKDSATNILSTTKFQSVEKLCNFVLNTNRGIPYKRIINE